MKKSISKFAILLMVMSVLFAGCIQEEKTLNQTMVDNGNITIKFIDNKGPIVTKEDADFSDFELVNRVFLVTPENLTMTLYTETSHGSYLMNASDELPEGFRIYAESETYNVNATQRYLMLQYKVFDTNESLNESMDMTVAGYVKEGYVSKKLENDTKYTQRIFILENNTVEMNGIINNNSGTNNGMINNSMNVTWILFTYDTVIGRIGVRDHKDKSLNESLKLLDIVLDRINIGTKSVKKHSSFGGIQQNVSLTMDNKK